MLKNCNTLTTIFLPTSANFEGKSNKILQSAQK